MKNHLGEKTYSSFSSWRVAVEKLFPCARIEGNKEIAFAKNGNTGVGEWDGETGILYGKN